MVYTVSARDTGRPMDDILDEEWEGKHKENLHYYLNGVKNSFL